VAIRPYPALLRVKLGDNYIRETSWEDEAGEQQAKDWL
jgi:hypothetical protein